MRNGMLFFFLFPAFFTRAQDIDVLHYRFEIALSDSTNWIHGKATIEFKARKNLNSIVLDFPTLRKPNDLRATGVYQGKKDNNRCTIKTQNAKLAIGLRETLMAGEETQLTVFYTGIPDDGLIISKNKYGDRTFFADNWPNRAHRWLPCVDTPDDKASFEFIVTAPSHYSVVSNGVKVEEKEVADGIKLTHWKEDVPSPTKVMVIGVARFATKVYDDSPKGIPVSAWVYPQDSSKGFYDYAVATDMLKFFSNYIAPFPYNKLANVQSKTIFGGMENASCIFYAESTVTGDRSSEDVLAHEIAHQWFGDMATEKSFAHLWLSEGFATYFTDIYFEQKYGREAFLKRLKKERSEAIAFAKSSTHPVVDTTPDLMSLLNANSYQKGAWVLHMLRQEVGDSTFHKIIRAYYNAYKGSNADTRDFEAIAEKISGKNLKRFFDQWLYRPGVPQLETALLQTKIGTCLAITQKQTCPFQFSLTLTTGQDGTETKQTIEIKEKLTKIPLPKNTNYVVLDNDTTLLYEGKPIVQLK